MKEREKYQLRTLVFAFIWGGFYWLVLHPFFGGGGDNTSPYVFFLVFLVASIVFLVLIFRLGRCVKYSLEDLGVKIKNVKKGC